LTELTIALVVFLFPLAYSPGPGNMFFAATGAKFGFSGTLQASFGYHVATWVVTFCIGLGFGKMAASFPEYLVYTGYLGSAYIFYLAWKFISEESLTGEAKAKSASYLDGVVLLVFNPKAYVIISVMFTQFLSMGSEGNIALILWITTIFTLNNLLAFSIWSYAGDKILSRFRNNAQAKTINVTFGVVLACVAFWMLVNTLL